MFKLFTKNKKGFTLVELVVVLALLSFGVLALANMFKVTYNSFEKAQERSTKQEAVKYVAELLRTGSDNVAAAQTADIFSTTDVVPTGDTVDEAYSYLYAEKHASCSECGEDWDMAKDVCTKQGCSGGTKEFDGYFLYILNKGVKRANARQLSDVPIYATVRVFETPIYDDGPIENQGGVVITLAALENEYDYESGKAPISDEIYYSLDVAYHFPNIVTKDTGGTVNYVAKSIISTANTYNTTGGISGTAYASECFKKEPNGNLKLDANGEPTYEKCSPAHCGCDPKKKTLKDNAGNDVPEGKHYCADCDCECPAKNGLVLRVYVDSILTGDEANTSVDVPSLCFIATASYGHDSGEVGLLCKFRDECLLTNPLGTAFVNAYYKLSPPVADFIRESEPLKAAVRVGLKPLIAIATNALDEDAAKQNAPWFIAFMLCGAGATATLIKVDKRRKKLKE